MNIKSRIFAKRILSQRPDAFAEVRGSEAYPNLRGLVSFYAMLSGTLVVSEVSGLPFSTEKCKQAIFGMHVHEGNSCTGNAEDPFADAKGHYNPDNCKHPQHAGDLPPLFGNDGSAWDAVFTNRFKPRDVIGRTIIIHGSPDDFTTQPSGNSGKKIACGVIKPK